MLTNNPSNIVENFHRLPHYDFSFQQVDSTFAPTNQNYQEALGQLTIPLTLIATLFTLFFMIRACCGKNSRSRYGTRPSKCSKVSLVILMVLSAVGVALMFFANIRATNAVKSFSDHASATVSLINKILKDCGDTSTASDNTSTNASAIDVPVSDQFLKQNLIDGLSSFSQQLSSVVDSTTGTINIDKWNSDLKDGDQARGIATMASSGLLGGLVLLTLLAMFCRSYCWIRFCYVVLIIAFFCCWLTSSVELALSVGASDFCMDPNTFITTEITNTRATYYITCDGSVPFPFSSDFDTAQQEIGRAYLASVRLSQSTPAFSAIVSDIQALNASMLSVKNELDCRTSLHDAYQSTVNVACDDGMAAIAALTFAHGVVGLLFLITVLFVARSLIAAFYDAPHYLDINDDEYTPLATGYSGHSGSSYGTGNYWPSSSYTPPAPKPTATYTPPAPKPTHKPTPTYNKPTPTMHTAPAAQSSGDQVSVIAFMVVTENTQDSL